MRTEGKYVLVRHSGFGYGGDPQFRYGLESRQVTDKTLERAVAAGATVYDSYMEAENAAMRLMYPDGYNGLTPIADRAGEFSLFKVDGLQLFVQHAAASVKEAA